MKKRKKQYWKEREIEKEEKNSYAWYKTLKCIREEKKKILKKIIAHKKKQKKNMLIVEFLKCLMLP